VHERLRSRAKDAKTYREWKERQRDEFGDDIVPTVRCFHHGYDRVLNLSYSGRLYLSGWAWEPPAPRIDYATWARAQGAKEQAKKQ